MSESFIATTVSGGAGVGIAVVMAVADALAVAAVDFDETFKSTTCDRSGIAD